MVKNHATYGGRSMVEGVTVDLWITKGFANNKYYQAVGAPALPVKLDQGNCVNVYDRKSFVSSPSGLDPRLFIVPDMCSSSKACKSQSPCIYGLAQPEDLQRARTKIPRQPYRGNSFVDMAVKLNRFLSEYNSAKRCESWTVPELQEFQLRILDLRAPDLDEVYQVTADNRKLSRDAKGHKVHWESFRNISALIGDADWKMQRDGHCHEAVMWFVHHLTEATRQKLAKQVAVPMLPHYAHRCPSSPTEAQRLLCGEYLQQTKCLNCHGEPNIIMA